MAVLCGVFALFPLFSVQMNVKEKKMSVQAATLADVGRGAGSVSALGGSSAL
jgi:hypothetical protein